MHADAWQSPDVQASMIDMIATDLSRTLARRAVVCRPDILRNWDGFLDAMSSTGGAIQAVPTAMVR